MDHTHRWVYLFLMISASLDQLQRAMIQRRQVKFKQPHVLYVTWMDVNVLHLLQQLLPDENL